jgi:SAM-dependent methyltransferase
MTCCTHCQGLEREFDSSTARSDLRRYRRRGPLPSTALLLSALRRHGVGGATLLDIGGGVGAIHHELLDAGAVRAIHVDASGAYLEAAREEARQRRHEARVRFLYGDFTDLAPEVPECDVVTLDRVICCYPDMPRLVSLSARRARRLLGLVFPRENWWVRPLFPLANTWFRLRRCPFRVYLHPGSAVVEVARAEGLRPVFRGHTAIWQVLVFAR